VTSAQQPSFDVAVVGGGAIGLAVAWRATQRRLRVVLLERGELGAGATRVAGGMLAPVAEAEYGRRAQLELGIASAAYYPAFVAELRDAAGGLDPGYRACGALLVARDADEALALEREREQRALLGVELERLLPSQARRLEPALAPTIRLALRAPDDHLVDPRALTDALARAARGAGAALRAGTEVAAVSVSGARVTGVELAGGERIAAEQVVIAAGCWSASVPGIPEAARVPVRPVKGQILRLRDPAGPGLVERVLDSESVYVVPYGDGRYALGGTVEDRGFDTTVTALAVHELLREGSELVPGLLELELEEVAAGLRPGTPDNGPIVGRGALAGLVWATGHYRNGILNAPLTGAGVAALLAGEELPPVLRAFAPERFAHAEAAA